MRSMTVSKVLGAVTAVLIPLASQAQAATRTICLEFEIRDERFDCPTPGTVGAKRACDPVGNYVNPIGMHYELWDKDSTGDDEYIGTWRIAGTGSRCVTFEWENASYSKGEDHPDVYAKLRYTASAVSALNGATVRAADASGSPRGAVTWRDFNNGAHVRSNCTGSCSLPGGVMVPTHSTTSDMSQRFQMIDSAQRVLDMYNGDLDDREILARYPGTGCPTGMATARDDFCIPSGLGSEGDRVAHEMGHVVQMQMFNQDFLRDVIVGGGWNMGTSSFETQSAATTEGWAAYVGAVAWFDPQNSAVAPMYGGQNLENASLAQAVCSDNITLPLQAAKAFWDLDDWNNEAGTRSGVADNDQDSKQTAWMALQWDEFSDGTGNREDFETGDNGVNVRDYLFRVNDSTAEETMLEHNCLVGQTDL
jgi:hypothetical protein